MAVLMKLDERPTAFPSIASGVRGGERIDDRNLLRGRIDAAAERTAVGLIVDVRLEIDHERWLAGRPRRPHRGLPGAERRDAIRLPIELILHRRMDDDGAEEFAEIVVNAVRV